MKKWKLLIMIPVIIFAFQGCGTLLSNRTILVPHGDAVRLRETVKNVKVWIKAADGEILPGIMNLPEGWYVLPLEDE